MAYNRNFNNNAPKTFYFHDYETGGLSTSLDRAVQFAGIRTDENFNIIGEPLNIICHIQDDYVPSLEATLVTGITPNQCQSQGMKEADFCKAILAELGKSGTCGVGYNSIKFDDNVTRNMLFRNLQDPYQREWANGNSRWDIINVVRAAYAFYPSRITWPKDEKGSVVFKLDKLAELNGLKVERAHDALSDVETTIQLAKLLKERVPELFDLAYSHRLKNSAAQKLDLQKNTPIFYLNTAFGIERGNASPVMPLFSHPSMGNVVLAWDLNVSPQVLIDLPVEELSQRMFYNAERENRLPMFQIFTNQSPIMFNHAHGRDVLGVERFGIHEGKDIVDLNDVKDSWNHNYKLLKANLATIQNKVNAIISLSNNEYIGPDVEQQLYAGFCSNGDRALLNRIVSQKPKDMGDEVHFENNTLYQELLFRYRARNWKETLSDDELIRWEGFVADKLLKGGAAEFRTLEMLDDSIQATLSNSEATLEAKQLAQDMAKWVDSRYDYLKGLELNDSLKEELVRQLNKRVKNPELESRSSHQPKF